MSPEASRVRRLAMGTLLAAFDGAEAPEWVVRALGDGLAGVTLFARNIETPEQVAKLTADLYRVRPDAVVATDEEGGDVTRLGHRFGSPYPGNAALGAADDTDLTQQVYAGMAAELAGIGVSVDFAPSVDVNNDPANPIIGTRAFGSDPVLVSRHAAAAVRGLQQAGVAACAKHFPGHGAVAEDSHLTAPVTDVGLDILRQRDLPPFRAAVAAGSRAVMSAHIRVPDLTGEVPATLSAAALTGLLRTELGFEGVVVTDALDMGAVEGTVGMAEGSVQALRAGADLLCIGSVAGASVVHRVVDHIVGAVDDGRLPLERLHDAANRARGLGGEPTGSAPSRAGAAAGREAARRALVVEGTVPPLRRPVLVEAEVPPSIAEGPRAWGLGALTEPPLDVRRVHDLASGLAAADGAARNVVLVLRDAHRFRWQRDLAQTLQRRADLVVVELGQPVWRPDGCAAYLAAYGAALPNVTAVAEALGLR